MASRIQGITVEIGGDTTKLSKALESVNKSIKGTQSGLKDVNKLLKLDPSNTELVVQKQKMLKDAIEATKEKCNMIVPYDSCNYDETYNLINIADFNSLIAQSQSNNTPVFLLTQEQVQKSGSVWENMKKNIEDFNQIFKERGAIFLCAPVGAR